MRNGACPFCGSLDSRCCYLSRRSYMKIHRHTAVGKMECELCPAKTEWRASIFAAGRYPFVMVVCTMCYWNDPDDMDKGVSKAVTDHLRDMSVLTVLLNYDAG